MNKKKNKYFFIAKPHLKHLLFLLYFLVSLGENYIQDFLENENNLATPFFDVYIYILSDFLSIIPYLIVKYRTKSDIMKTPTLRSSSDLELIYNDNGLYTTKKDLINILLLASSDYIAQISLVIYYLIKQEYTLDIPNINLNSIFIFNIIFLIILSKLLLHTRFYRHHYFSCLIIILVLLALVILDIIQINKEEGNKLLSNIYLFLRIVKTFLYSFEDVIGKVLLLYQNFTVYSLLLNKSIIQIIFSIVFSFPFIFIKLKDEENNERTLFSMIGDIFENKRNILLYFFLIIMNFFYNVFLWQIIDNFSVNHLWLAQMFEGLGFLILDIITNSITLDRSLRIVLYIFLLIIACIYNEFLVVNICGLSKDTKLFLDYKAKKEKEDQILLENIKEDVNLDETFED